MKPTPVMPQIQPARASTPVNSAIVEPTRRLVHWYE